MGVTPGIGVTHLGISLANYSVSQERRKTAVVELSGNHAFEKLTGTSEPFEWNRIIMYPNRRKHQVADIINGDYEVVIFDMGCSYYKNRDELLRCDRKLILGTLAPWRKEEYIRFVREEMDEDRYARCMMFLTYNGNKKDKREFFKLTGQTVETIPYFPEPLSVEKNRYEFFRGIL